MKITVESVETINRLSIPDMDITICDDLPEFPYDMIEAINIYFRDTIDCPFARGNWLADIYFNDGGMGCIKLPKEMEEAQVIKFFQPIIDRLKKKSH